MAGFLLGIAGRQRGVVRMSPNPGTGTRLPIPGSLTPMGEIEQINVAKVRQESSEAVARVNQCGPNPQAMAAALSTALQHFQSYEPMAADLASQGYPGLANLLQQIESDIQTALGIQQQSTEATQKAQQDARKIVSDTAAEATADFAKTVKDSNDRVMQAISGLSEPEG